MLYHFLKTILHSVSKKMQDWRKANFLETCFSLRLEVEDFKNYDYEIIRSRVNLPVTLKW